jgi:glutathione peroxidase
VVLACVRAANPPGGATDVNGGRTHPVYQFLKKATKSEARDIAWNFETKFLVSRDGAVIKRFSDAFDPDSLRGEIDQMLARPDL